MNIHIVSDLICPWCFIGTRRLEQALESLPEGQTATVTYLPFLLDPSIPKEGVDLRERLAKKYGADPEQMFDRVEGAARSSGIDLDFSKIRRTVSTLPGHTLLRHAIAKGTQRGLAKALFAAYFLEGRDISDTAVLTQLGAAAGFAEGEVATLVGDEQELALTRAEAQGLSAQGISGVPFFIFNGRIAVSGAQTPEILGEALSQAGA